MTAKEGTKNNPVKIKVSRAFFVHCPRCEAIIDCGDNDKKIECSECGRKFYTDFNLLDCGL